MSIDALPTAPDPNDPATFDARAAAFAAALPNFGVQANAQATATNVAAASALNAPGTLATSTTSNDIGTGAKTFTIQTGKAYAVGQTMVAARTSSPGTQMQGVVTAHNSTTGSITIQVDSYKGSGTGITDWTLSLTASGGTATAADVRAGTDPSKAITPKAQMDAQAKVPVAYASSWAPDLTAGIVFEMTLAGSITLANPSAMPAAGSFRIRFIRDATVTTGAIAFGSKYTFAYGVPFSITPGAGKIDDILMEIISATEIRLSRIGDVRSS